MLFGIEADTGDRIAGYLVPDNFSGRASAVICSRGSELLRLTTDEGRSALVEGRRHETGLCGFTIDEAKLPRLRELSELTIFEQSTRVPIYRRSTAGFNSAKVLRLETQLFPLTAIDRWLASGFLYQFGRLDLHGHETVEQIFNSKYITSMYASGRVLLRHLEYALDPEEVMLVTLIRDPYRELAERLIILKNLHLASTDNNLFSERDWIAFDDAIRFCASLEFENPHSLEKALKRMPDSVYSVLSNPLVRILAGQNDTDRLYSGSLSSALETLSTFKLVGLRHYSAVFLRHLKSEFGLQDPIGALRENVHVERFGQVLSQLTIARELLEYDLLLYAQVRDAVWQSSSGALRGS